MNKTVGITPDFYECHMGFLTDLFIIIVLKYLHHIKTKTLITPFKQLKSPMISH